MEKKTIVYRGKRYSDFDIVYKDGMLSQIIIRRQRGDIYTSPDRVRFISSNE